MRKRDYKINSVQYIGSKAGIDDVNQSIYLVPYGAKISDVNQI